MYLQLKAPFAAFRQFQSSAYRSTTPVPSPSTVYGLLLNLAGIEQRGESTTPVTIIRDDLPEMEVAIGIPQGAKLETALLTQQLHQYLVGASDKELLQKTHGAKPWIAPIRREVLIDVDVIIGVRAEQWLCDRIIQGLNGELDEPRYGIPFAGDNNFMFDSIEFWNNLPMNNTYQWYCPLSNNSRPSSGACRLTIWINREDNSKTKTAVFVPSNFCLSPPESAWIRLPFVNT